MKYGRTGERQVGALALAVISLAAGSACGFLAVLFRLFLNEGDRWRGVFVGWAQGEGVAGLAGAAYCRAIVGLMALADRLAWLPVEFCAAAIGSAIGALAWLAPTAVGDGDSLVQDLLVGDAMAVSALLVWFAGVSSSVPYRIQR